MTHTLGLREAAQRCGVSVNTIRKRQRDGRLPNTIVADTGWAIQLTDLIADGLEPMSPRALTDQLVSSRPKAEPAGVGPGCRCDAGGQQVELDLLRELVHTQRLHLDDLRAQLKIEGGNSV